VQILSFKMDIYKQINLLKDEIIGEEIFREKNVACVVAISDEYVQFALDHISRLSTWDVCVLTDQPEKFEGLFYVEKYPNAVFSLVDKILFCLKMSIKLKCGVTLIDADDIRVLKPQFIEEKQHFPNFTCIAKWIIGHVELHERLLGEVLLKHMETLELGEGEWLEAPLERVIYIPYLPELPKLVYYVEMVKPSLDYHSIWAAGKWRTLGQHEGAALIIGMLRLGLPLDLYEEIPIEV